MSVWETIRDNPALFAVLCCVIPMLLVILLAILTLRFTHRLITADPEKIRQQYQTLQQEYPNLSREELLNKIIHQQAIRSGIIGAITGFGGFATLLIGLPIDVYTSLRIQSAVVELIAYAYGKQHSNALEQHIKTSLVMTGSQRVTKITIDTLMSILARLLGKTFAKLIPVLGAVVSFGVNYVMTRGTGRVAREYYAHQQRQ